MIRPILKIPDPILRKKATAVGEITEEIRQLVQDMKETMYHEPGCGLAAPQIGVSLRVIVFDASQNREGFQALINPKIVKAEGQQKGPEACLSIPEISGEVLRAVRIQVEGRSPDSQKISLALSDLAARILQHEIDHLDGILFIDRLGIADRDLIKKRLRKISQAAPNL